MMVAVNRRAPECLTHQAAGDVVQAVVPTGMGRAGDHSGIWYYSQGTVANRSGGSGVGV